MKETPMQEEFDMEKELQQEFIQELAEFFKIFGDATRIRILQTLLEGERNVGDLADVLEMSQSAVSHQLRVLRQNDLVKYRKEGKTVFYSLDDEHIRMVLEQGMRICGISVDITNKKEIGCNDIGVRISENYSLNFRMLYEQLFK